MATIVLKLRGRELSRHPIERRITRIGRDVTNDIAVDNPGVSRVHASIRYTAGAFHVFDEGSANGIFVNGNEVDTCPLQDGDEIQFGKFTAVFESAGGVPPRQLGASSSGSHAPVNPVETTSISTADIRKMIEQQQHTQEDIVPPEIGAAPRMPAIQQRPPMSMRRTMTSSSPPTQPSHRHFDTYTGPPMFPEDEAGKAKGGNNQTLLLAVGALGGMVVVLTGLVLYLLLKG